MKKTIILTSAIVLTSLAMGAQAAHAESTVPFDSKATFEFKTEDPENPEVNPPVDKDKPVTPPTGQKGLLAIDAVSSFNFGSATISGGETKANAAIPAGETLGIQVTDKRGTGAGWNVQAKISDFKDKTDDKKILKGATVMIPVGTFITTAGGDTEAAPTASNAQGTVIGTAETQLITAAKDTGLGSWVNDWAGDVELTIPGGNLVGNYEAAITWTLIDTPTGTK
ncbi:WxL domain-containing protein [Enterococcus quebecensis]|uniref:WxL domain-containing protein n=1 Tax=Enterococcus quebecensis TaxID=903983 RepID=A0A1E5GV03_9ENTE|nr:WxL domain-containing protein [Enterococcus quebecensis]OEG16505.1 hypothetical protein BCR23_06345 [Enterococcus quebecensis]OJG74121.1 hypothetical protein RV12_GL002759 [Enterococcus quebecensis]